PDVALPLAKTEVEPLPIGCELGAARRSGGVVEAYEELRPPALRRDTPDAGLPFRIECLVENRFWHRPLQRTGQSRTGGVTGSDRQVRAGSFGSREPDSALVDEGDHSAVRRPPGHPPTVGRDADREAPARVHSPAGHKDLP